VFKTSEALDLLFGALARTSVVEALYFSRAHPASARRPLFERLVASVLESAEGGVGRRGKELVSAPLTGDEERWLHEFLAVGEGRKSKNARVVAQMRTVVTGRGVAPGMLSGKAR
jgi:hypothetical protein